MGRGVGWREQQVPEGAEDLVYLGNDCDCQCDCHTLGSLGEKTLRILKQTLDCESNHNELVLGRGLGFSSNPVVV